MNPRKKVYKKTEEPKNRTFYTLRCKTADPTKNEVMGMEFDTFEEAYDHMVLTYINEKNKSIPHKLWGIWRTQITVYNGRENSNIRPVWAA